MRKFIVLLFIVAIFTTEAYGDWKQLRPGMDLATFSVKNPRLNKDAGIVILRIDPKHWEFALVGRSRSGEPQNMTAKGWCQKYNLTSAINAGMFAKDYSTHVGYLGTQGHVNNAHVNRYTSVAAFGPRRGKGLPEFRIFDLDDPNVKMEMIIGNYASAVQNLRLIKRQAENRWGQQEKMWSEAALGEDSAGRVLFILTRSPFSMHDFNRALLSLGIGLVAAQHLEGGPEAQLYLHVGRVTLEMFGSYETSFKENEDNAASWPIPNVLGVRPKPR
jgi:hypothetical protein